MGWVPSIPIYLWPNSFLGCNYYGTCFFIFWGFQLSTQNVESLWNRVCDSLSVESLWNRVCDSLSFWVESWKYPKSVFFNEDPSNGLQIVLAVWRMIKANKNPILKISPQNFCKTCSAWNEKTWTSAGGSYLKNRILEHFNQLRFKAKQIHLTWQYFCEMHLGEAYENLFNNRNNKMIRFFCLVVSYQREKNVFCVVFFSYGVIFHNIKRRVWFKIV